MKLKTRQARKPEIKAVHGSTWRATINKKFLIEYREKLEVKRLQRQELKNNFISFLKVALVALVIFIILRIC